MKFLTQAVHERRPEIFRRKDNASKLLCELDHRWFFIEFHFYYHATLSEVRVGYYVKSSSVVGGTHDYLDFQLLTSIDSPRRMDAKTRGDFASFVFERIVRLRTELQDAEQMITNGQLSSGGQLSLYNLAHSISYLIVHDRLSEARIALRTAQELFDNKLQLDEFPPPWCQPEPMWLNSLIELASQPNESAKQIVLRAINDNMQAIFGPKES